MNWPWRRNRNRHEWDHLRFVRINGEIIGSVLECSRCLQTAFEASNFHTEPEDYPPTYGCTSLPLPCHAPAPDSAALPVVVD